MMRSMLRGANLSNPFWSSALLHAVYVKNRIPYRALDKTPYEKLYQRKPNLAHLQVFGSCVVVKKQGKRPGKLNHHISTGFFLRFGSNPRNIVYFDEKTQTRETGTTY